MVACNFWKVHAVAGLLITGAGSAVMRKVVFQETGKGRYGIVHHWVKPWFTTTQSATASTCCLAIYYIYLLIRSWQAARAKQRSHMGDVHTPFLSGSEGYAPVPSAAMAKRPRRSFLSATLRLSVPAVVGQLALIFQGIGLKYTTASISQMVSGSCIIFTAILSVTVLRRVLNWMHLAGIALALLGVLVVSVATLMSSGKGADAGVQVTPMQLVYGVLITLFSQFIQAIQLVAEELLISDLQLHPQQLLGYEGLLALLLHVVVLLPLAYVLPGTDVGGRQEDTLDTFIMLKNSRLLRESDYLYFWTVLGTLAYGLAVTEVLGSVFRAVLLTTRTALVWAVGLALYYGGVDGGQLGEPWLFPSSWLELAGFALLLYGTILYAQGSTAVAVEQMIEEVQEQQRATPRVAPPLQTRTSLQRRGSLRRQLSTASATLLDRRSWIIHHRGETPRADAQERPLLLPASSYRDPFMAPLPPTEAVPVEEPGLLGGLYQTFSNLRSNSWVAHQSDGPANMEDDPLPLLSDMEDEKLGHSPGEPSHPVKDDAP